MKKKVWILALVVLLTASLACSLFTGGSKSVPPAQSGGEQSSAEQASGGQSAESQSSSEAAVGSGQSDGGAQNFETEFPVPDGVTNFTDMGNGAINFQAKIGLQDAISFYRDSFGKLGYKEREINTAITDSTFSLVFDGHASGKAIVVQGVDLGSGSTNINIRFEDI